MDQFGAAPVVFGLTPQPPRPGLLQVSKARENQGRRRAPLMSPGCKKLGNPFRSAMLRNPKTPPSIGMEETDLIECFIPCIVYKS